jgi:diguanylate cyclase (GGDEF)-like protein
MTLFKQIAVMLSIFLFIILTTVLVLNFQSSNKSVQDNLYEDAKNTATSLSLSLGSANGDISMMSTMINANFDSGYYKKITLVDVEDNILYSRENENEIVTPPEWFLNIIDIKAPIANANVSAGWSQVGILSVQSTTTYAIEQLYTIFKNLLISFAIIATIALIILNLLLHTVLRPLTEVQRQAAAIIRNEFIIQNNIPYTKEFKDVVLGMNNMVAKIKAMFEQGNKELKFYKEKEYIDQDTGLKNRKYFIDKLPAYFKVDASHTKGTNIIIAFSGVVEANKEIGHQEVNNLFITIADIFKNNTKNIKDVVIARMNGTEFSILLPGYSGDKALEIAKNIQHSCKESINILNLDNHITFISIGLYEYNHLNTISQLLSRSDNALAQAKFSTKKLYLEKEEDVVKVMGKEAWKTVIKDAIRESRFHFVSWSVMNTKTKKLAHNVLSINLDIDQTMSYSYAQFMAPAIQSNLSVDIYENIVNMLFTTPNILQSDSTYSLRLPHEYLESPKSYNQLKKLLETNRKTLTFKLIIEIPDILIYQTSAYIQQYVKLFKKHGIDIGIFEFIGESSDYQYLQDLRPIYIKGEANYFLTQDNQSLSALRLISDSVGISLIAVGVMEMETLSALEKKGLHIFQGRVTEMLSFSA